MRSRTPRLESRRGAVAPSRLEHTDAPTAADTVEQDPAPRRPGRLIEPAVEPPWTEYLAAAERLASDVAIDRWPAAVSVEEFLVLLLAVDRLIARASQQGAEEQIGVLRAWKDLFVEFHRVRGEADRRAEQRTKPLADGRRGARSRAASELEAIRSEIETIRRREGCQETPAIRLYLQARLQARDKKRPRQPKKSDVAALAKRLYRARTPKKKPDTTT